MRKTLPALPELVMETSQEHQGPSDTQSTTELGTKEFTEPGRRGAGGSRRAGWGTGSEGGSGMEPRSTGLRKPGKKISHFRTLKSGWGIM